MRHGLAVVVGSIVLLWILAPCVVAADYVLSFQERDELDRWIPHDISGAEKTLKGKRVSVRRDSHGTVIPEEAVDGLRSQGKHFLQVLVNGKEVYLNDVGQGGPL